MSKKQIMDGCTAATHVAYAMSEVATIFPITPIASMGQIAQKWALEGRKNIFGQTIQVEELESELGAAGATHGALAGGALATTFTNSQGLMLMIPNMIKMAGELLPAVFHVGCRSLANHALSIFGDQQDVDATRPTGFAQIASASVQETMDLAVVAHMAAIEGRMPVLHFFDGWRTSNEMNTIEVIGYDTIASLVDMKAVRAFRARALNPLHPDLRGSAQNADVYFQNREGCNKFYDAFPGIVQDCMNRFGAAVGRHYHLVDYVGAPDADRVIVVMASGAQVVQETVEYMLAKGEKVGVAKIRLNRPFPAEALRQALPKTVKIVAALDRSKDPGAQRDPLCTDVMLALRSEQASINVIGGRFGLSSKEFNPSMVKAVFDEMAKPQPKPVFTVGINDDVTHLSLEVNEQIHTQAALRNCQAVFYGIGHDGTVGGTKQVAHILGDTADNWAQAYFEYSAKKSGGYTVSQLRIGPKPITSCYRIEEADYVGCHRKNYVTRFQMVKDLKQGGIFVLNCPWDLQQLETHLPARMKQLLAQKKAKFYTIDADAIAQAHHLGEHINMPMEIAFLKLVQFIPFKEAYNALTQEIRTTYAYEGQNVVQDNLDAIAQAVDAIKEVAYPPTWAKATDGGSPEVHPPIIGANKLPESYFAGKLPEGFDWMRDVHDVCMRLHGNSIPVSYLAPDGTMPMGTTANEKRRIASFVPQWQPDKCVRCAECSLVCPHAAIRPYVLTDDELKQAPNGFATVPCEGTPQLQGMHWRIQVYVEDCLGCESCSLICPGEALPMAPAASQYAPQIPLLTWAQQNVAPKQDLVPRQTIVGSQLQTPCMEFSGACAGCGETPYAKLLTQLFGDRLIIANATGCSSVWGANFPSNAYCTRPDGKGPAWGNSLFEDNGEYGYGILVAQLHRRDAARQTAQDFVENPGEFSWLRNPIQAWLNAFDSPEQSQQTAEQMVDQIKGVADKDPRLAYLVDHADMLGFKSVWAMGGDGWAYDIGFAGLDHVLASGLPVKILVLDTECYSNTGGQTSKATPRSAVAKYSPDGKRTVKKQLGRMMMQYGSVYVASIALGADYQQAINALSEAERYPGAAIVIAYCPCLEHGIKKGLGHSILSEKAAVESGYWPLYRYDPAANQGRGQLTVDCDRSNGELIPYINSEDRYADLLQLDPAEAGHLQPMLEQDSNRTLSQLLWESRKKE